jgi:trimethylamine--corrinoid protein Co-methyltransferase
VQRGFKRNFKPLEVLTEAQIDDIEKGVYEILEFPGLKFDGKVKEALEIFKKNGCTVEPETGSVRFPPGLVKECIQLCPGSFPVEARDPAHHMVFGENRVYFQPGPGMWYIDLDTFETRLPTRHEFYDAIKVYDALPNLHFFHGNSPNTNIEGVHPLLSTIETYAARARYSAKTNIFYPAFENDRFNIEIAKVVGAKGLSGIGAASPLTWSDDAIGTGMRAVRAGVPLIIAGGSVWGASAPATIAGELVTNIAESLGPLILAQLMVPGHPVIPGSFTFPMNMRTGDPLFGNITIALATAGLNQFWRRFTIPTQLIEAAIPNSKCIDFQSGYEKAMLALIQALSGGCVVWIHGTVYGELTAHPVQAILDDDIAGMIGRFLEGIEIDQETLGIELIQKIGPVPGFYLDTEHTRKWWKKEQFTPRVADTLNLAEWRKTGKKSTIDYAKEKMQEIIETHEVSVPLTKGQDEAIENILSDAREYYTERIRST